MRAKEFTIKKRDPNWQTLQAKRTSGASGAHRDKKKDQKQGYEKHKGKVDEEAAGVGIVTKQNATVDVPVGGEYMNVKKLFPKKKKAKAEK